MNYFEHNAKRSNRTEVALDIIEFDQPHAAGIEVAAYVARETGRGR